MIAHGRIFRLLLVATLLAAAGSVTAQTAGASASDTTGASSASSATTAKAAKAANRKLAHRVETALARTRGLNASGIFVQARAGHITLSGSVPDNDQIPLAVHAAQQVDGVKEVENLLRITPQPL